LTPVTPNCQVYLADVPHYLVPDVMECLGVSERQVYRWFDDGVLTKKHYPDEDSKGVCVPASEVHDLDRQRQEARTSA
jgi:predicted site-specific integrase-resolvase